MGFGEGHGGETITRLWFTPLVLMVKFEEEDNQLIASIFYDCIELRAPQLPILMLQSSPKAKFKLLVDLFVIMGFRRLEKIKSERMISPIGDFIHWGSSYWSFSVFVIYPAWNSEFGLPSEVSHEMLVGLVSESTCKPGYQKYKGVCDGGWHL